MQQHTIVSNPERNFRKISGLLCTVSVKPGIIKKKKKLHNGIANPSRHRQHCTNASVKKNQGGATLLKVKIKCGKLSVLVKAAVRAGNSQL